MTIAFVQSKSAGSSGDVSTLTASFDSAPTNGNLLVATLSYRSGGARTYPSGWAEAVQIGSSINVSASIAWKIAGASESSDVAISAVGTAGGMTICIAEFSGIATSTPVDQSDTSNVDSTVTTIAIGPTGTLSQADELAIAVVGVRLEAPGSSIAFTDSFTTQEFADAVSGTRHVTGGLGYKIVSATTALSNDPTWTNARMVSGCMVTFKGGFAFSQAVIIG